MNHRPETDLVLEAQRGDDDAFAELVRLYQRRAVSVAYRLLNNMEDASDVTQDAFVRAYRHLDQLDDPAKFGGWLLRVVSNLSLNYRRSRSIRRAVSLDDGHSFDDGDGSSLADRLAAPATDNTEALPQDTHDAVSQALATLPEKQRLALILFSVEGMPQKQVADILECSVELVKWNVFQARKKLRGLLATVLSE